MSHRLVLPQMEIKLVLWSNFSHLGGEYKGLRKKHVIPSHPEYKQGDSFRTATSPWQLDKHVVQKCLKHGLKVSQWTQTLESWESYNFQVCPSRQWNLECKPQLETRRKPYLFYLTIFKWRTKRSFAIRPWKRTFELPREFPPPLELVLDWRQEQGGEGSGNTHWQGLRHRGENSSEQMFISSLNEFLFTKTFLEGFQH